HGDSLVFLHKVKPGTVNRSYGLQVATLAGVPREVVEQAKIKLRQLETLDTHKSHPAAAEMPLTNEKTNSKVEEFIAALKPDELSPKEALDLLYQLKKLV
ncbi:MAG: DNA mismatch repair protein MutS, partial [Gammaproteobacteria bacterium]|nr:DNA mismatch repair protein MutS [Gammaproteobacteria bacterium]